MTSHRVVWRDRGVAEVEEFEVPARREGQLLLRTRASLVSPGTERAFFLGLPNTSGEYPQHPGYSAIGEVVEADAGSGLQAGDRVAAATGHAMHAVVDAARCGRVPDGLPDEEAVFFSLAAIALQGVRKARIEVGEPVAVIGAGLVGLMALQLSRINGALPAVAIDRDERRLAFARKVGADAALVADEGLKASVRRLIDGDGPPVVIEATGHPEAILLAMDLAGRFGRVILLGSTRGVTPEVNFYRDVHQKGLSVIGAHNGTRPARESRPCYWTLQDDHRVVLELLARGRLEVRPLITHRFAWTEAPRAYDLLKEWNLDSLGMVLDWREG